MSSLALALFPQKVVSAAEPTSYVSLTFDLLGRVSLARNSRRPRLQGISRSKRDFLRGGQELSSLTLSQLREEIAWEFEKLPFCYAKPQFSRR